MWKEDRDLNVGVGSGEEWKSPVWHEDSGIT